jgi:hypothetical protein
MSTKNVGEIKGILGEAVDQGVISKKALQIIDINDTVLAGINGMDVEEIQATDVTLVTMIIDDSGSIRFSGLTDSVREGQNQMIGAIEKSKQKDNILIAQWKLGSEPELIQSYLPIDQSIRLDHSNYNPQSGTALYDTWMTVAAANVAYAQKLKASGRPVKSIIVIITDGRDEGSARFSASDCARINKDLLMSEQFIIAFVGVADNTHNETLFRMVAEEMGFPDGSVLTADATPSEMRKVFNVVSQSAIRASQKAVTPGAQNSFFNP